MITEIGPAGYYLNSSPILEVLYLTFSFSMQCFKWVNNSARRKAIISPLPLKLMLFWHQIFIAAAEIICQQGFSSFFENLNFLVLAMPG